MRDGVWSARLRWRLRGATMWPAFLLALPAEAVLLHLLPIAGDQGPGLFGALLLATFFNLVVVAAGAPVGGRLLRLRRPALPQVVADDRAGTALIGALAVALLVAGLAHRPAMEREEREFATQARSARSFVLGHAPAAVRANVQAMDTLVLGPDLYRTCVPQPSAQRAFCVIVTTRRHPPVVKRDPDERPNATMSPLRPGRPAGGG
jgi:hypothetical protein